ncbi:hypothetical protein EDC94DRAFT_617385 [Helicostylum pulchrum]|nr:hypothetical protein EDC94DRAFT_617385 [Helicostylum pulchrum]
MNKQKFKFTLLPLSSNLFVAPEKRIKSAKHELTKIHSQWFSQDAEKKEKLSRQEPVIVQRIEKDYAKLEDLATERITLAEEALKLVDRHLIRLQNDLDKHDREHPELAPISAAVPTRSYTIPHGRKSMTLMDSDFEEEGGGGEEEGEQLEIKLEPDYQTMIANRNQKRKKKEERDKDEPLYCFCQQVSYGEMVACDGENCSYEWFHMDCVGLDEPPKGAWYCEDCSAELRNKRKSHQPIHKKMKRKRESHA